MAEINERAELIESRVDKTVTGRMMAVAPSEFGGAIRPKDMSECFETAKLMALSGFAVRPFLRNNPGACLAIVMQSLEWGMSPFAVAQKVYVVNDQFAYEAQLIAALILNKAPVVGEPDYIYEGEGAALTCTVSFLMKSGKTLVYKSPPVGQITPKNSPLWKTDPQQQLGYYSIRAWGRRHTPGVLLGIYDVEEFSGDMAKDVTPVGANFPSSSGSMIERLKDRPKPVEGFSVEVVEKALAPEEPAPGSESATADFPLSSEPKATTETPPTGKSPYGSIKTPSDALEYVDYVKANVSQMESKAMIDAFWKGGRRLRNMLSNWSDDIEKQALAVIALRVQELGR